MYRKISFMLAAVLVMNLFGMVTPTMAQMCEVPDVVGWSEHDAIMRLTDILSVNLLYDYSDTIAEGHVISQDPAAGTVVHCSPFQTAIYLTICSREQFEILDYRGGRLEEAIGAINIHGLSVGTISYDYHEGYAIDHVMSQDPAPGTLVSYGTPVNLTVSLGPIPEMAVVPDVVGMSWSEAFQALLDAGLERGHTSYVCSATGVPDGHIISQSPSPGTEVDFGSWVSLQISTGSCPLIQVPHVTGMAQADAESAITAAGLVVGTISYQWHSIPKGHVIASFPSGGTMVPAGSSVDLLVSREQLEVPCVEGMAQADAESVLAAAGFPVQIGGYVYDCMMAPEGHVHLQDPRPGWVYQSTTVYLTISLGGRPIPDVVGMAQADAESAINNPDYPCIGVDIIVGTISYEYDNDIPEGHVISQGIPAGTRVCGALMVDLIVSLGPPGPSTVEVPDVVGMTYSDAASAIISAELSVGSIWYIDSDTVPDGCVISSYPAAGTVVDPGSEVDLEISSGPSPDEEDVTVPDVVGMNESDAKSVITSASLTVGAISNDYSDTVPKGFVISQSPAGGTSVSEGSSVLLTISLGPEPDDVPPVPPDASCLAAHWKLDDGSGNTAIDSSGNGFDITLHNTAWEDGVFGGAVHFHGIGAGDVWDFNYGENAVTVCAWVWHDKFRLGEIERYVTVGPFVAVIRKEYDGRLHFYIGTDGNLRHLWVSDVLTEGQWQHIAGTWDGLTQRLYIDGVEVTSQTPGGVLGHTSYVMISSVEEPFNGMLDDVRIYKCALSADSILQLFYAEPIECLVAHWKLDETSGNTAYDSSGNGNNGILYGNPTWQPTGGIIDGTLEFDGDGDYVEIPKIGDIVEFTYAMWVAQNQIDSGLIALIDHKDWVYGSVQFELRDGHPKVGINGAITPAGDLDAWGHTLTAGEWYHVALAKSATELLMYVDGEEAARRELITSDTVILGDGFIGAWVNPTWGQTRYFDGWLDDVRIYDCVLDENQIKALISAPPSPSPLNPLSEALDTSLSFTTGGSADWFSQTTTSYHDGDAAQSEDISDDQESWIQTTVSGKGTVKFYWMVSSEEEYDFLEFYIDGVLQEKISGLEHYWVQKTYTISTSGSHVLEWRYMKDVATSFGDDCGWVDKVEWVTTP